MKPAQAEWAAALAPAALLAVFCAAAAAVAAATLEAPERAALAALLEPRAALLAFVALAVALAGGLAARWAWLRWGAAPARVAEALQIALNAAEHRPLREAPGSEALARAVNTLLAERAAWRGDVAARVKEASRQVDQERSRLAALMAELTQSVVVCNLDGRILLYNARARLQFRALSQAPSAGGAELLGIGRSIYAVFDRQLVAHALESVQQRLARGVAHPSAQFVTGTQGGQLLRVQMAPVREPEGDAPDGFVLNGFVLVLDNITRDFADESERDRRLHAHTEASRASLGNLLAAVELIDDPALDADTRVRLQGVVRDEVQAMSLRIGELAEHTTQTMKTRWPLEEMQGADFMTAAANRIQALLPLRVSTSDVDATLWLKVDSFSLMNALAALAGRLRDEFEVKHVELRLARAGARAQLDLAWIGRGVSTETVIGWETDAMRVGDDAIALTVRDVVERHGGAFWFERERVRHASFFRFLLPLAEGGEALDAAAVLRGESRPEFYDFDLFGAATLDSALADRRLAELACTVFDTETTGLQPSQGDEILQIGATRIVAGKLRRQECFEQLVDPGRSIPEAGIAIHGITPAMVAGQPPIGQVLPAFHAFAADTVLVAHNAAFDMRFLQLKEQATGVRFEQPVLDTLLLSAVAHPNAESHGLEAIAERLGVPVLGRHTALGDAIVTAEVFLKLVPLLEAQGIRTLGQALEASQQTMHSRLRY